MSINNVLPNQEDILKDENGLWYFKKEEKEKILKYLNTATIEDFRDMAKRGDFFIVPTWYYLLNDIDIAKKLTEKDFFKELYLLTSEDYKNSQSQYNTKMPYGYAVVTNLDTTLHFIPNTDIMHLLKKQGVQFKITYVVSEDMYKMYEIIKSGVIDFKEEDFIFNKYNSLDRHDSIIQKILFSYKTTKESTKDLINMAMAINGFVELGCETKIKYKTLVSASDYFLSKEDNYKEIIQQYCPDLHEIMEKIAFSEKMNALGSRKSSKIKI